MPGVIAGMPTGLFIYGVPGHYATTIRGEAGLVAYYRMADASGNFTEDSGGTAISSTAGWTYSQAGAISGNNAARSNATGSGSRVIGSIPIGTAARSFEFWYNSVTNGANTGKGAVCSYGAHSTRNWFTVMLNESGSGNQIGVESWSDDKTLTATGLNDGTWHHIVVTMAAGASTVKGYMDGASLGTMTFGGGLNTSTSAFTFGVTDTGSFSLEGLIDEFAIYSVELTAAQILAHFMAR